MSEPGHHFESFVHLADVTDTSVLVGWGGFSLQETDDGWIVVDDDNLGTSRRRRGGTIGAESPPYGAAVVEVLGEGGEVVASATCDDVNHAWVEGLQPDTAYRYRVSVDGEPWAAGERQDWDVDTGRPVASGRSYDLRFRTHPPRDTAVPVTFLAFGDYGVGITNDEDGVHQRGVARTLDKLAATHPVRFLVSLGDNIYHGEADDLAQSGDEDDDWYLTFYEPYRYLIDHLPLYPAAGNHDGSDEESSDDRDQMLDNFYLDARFGPDVAKGRASLDPGLFYVLRVGGLLEMLCIDTSWGEEEGMHDFEQERSKEWLTDALPEDGGPGDLPVWRIPFCHHPAYCAGPHHPNMDSQIDHVIPLYQRAGVKLMLNGHEHNYQHGEVDGIHYVISGAAGKLREEHPFRFDEAGTRSWSSKPNCLLVEVDEHRITVTPYGPTAEGDEPRPLEVRGPDGRPTDPIIVIDREA